jgi:hypothetical protein
MVIQRADLVYKQRDFDNNAGYNTNNSCPGCQLMGKPGGSTHDFANQQDREQPIVWTTQLSPQPLIRAKRG